MSTHTIPSLQGTLAKHTKPTLQPNFAKEPIRPSRSNAGLKDSANFIDEQIENKNRQCLTKAIRNLGNVLILKFLALNKISGKLKINRFKIPNYA